VEQKWILPLHFIINKFYCNSRSKIALQNAHRVQTLADFFLKNFSFPQVVPNTQPIPISSIKPSPQQQTIASSNTGLGFNDI
jgi:hypothetical protein